jgi:RNA polymerase sigma-70 factor (ECF subfamily)
MIGGLITGTTAADRMPVSDTTAAVPISAVRALRSSIVDPSLLEDRDLVELAKSDRAAFAVLYRRHVDVVFRTSVRLSGGDRAAAEDITSVTFERALASIGKFEWRGGGVRPWLLRIAASQAAAWHRSRTRTIDRGRDAAVQAARLTPGADERVEDPMTALLIEGLAALPDRYRDVITLRYLGGLSPIEAAQALDCTVGALNAALHRALESLRTSITGATERRSRG